jgi:peroxiredoxin (alkyl hydroperoxide reductase subunit C)
MSHTTHPAPDPVEAVPVGLPLLNEPAPHFEAKTTHGVRKLTDYRGKYLVLFSHPADFTPVCTTEFIAFAKHHDAFRELDTELLGLSIDSNFAHLAWLRNMKEKLGVEIPFPVIEDLSMKVAHAYGMIHPGSSETSTVRAVFVIDRDGVLRAMVYYPKDNGRSVPEILRLVRALQTTDEFKVATPEGWTPGERVIVPPPATYDEASQRLAEAAEADYECVDWYLCKKDLNGASKGTLVGA